jgi:hypothetical protein
MNNNKIQTALEMLSKANVAMIEAISAAVNESENEEVIYTESDKYDGGEVRFIKYNENGELMMFDDCDNELVAIDDLSADDLYDICLQIA